MRLDSRCSSRNYARTHKLWEWRASVGCCGRVRAWRWTQVDYLLTTADKTYSTSKKGVTDSIGGLKSVRCSSFVSGLSSHRRRVVRRLGPRFPATLPPPLAAQLHETNYKTFQETSQAYYAWVQQFADWAKDKLNPIKGGQAALVSGRTSDVQLVTQRQAAHQAPRHPPSSAQLAGLCGAAWLCTAARRPTRLGKCAACPPDPAACTGHAARRH